jgi:lysophospholipase L1-like esterase
MATTPTSNPIPSEAPQDLKFNAGKIDEFVTSKEWTYTDRFGIKRYTIEGINYLAQQVMNAFGYVTLQGVTFTTGATVANPNEVLFNTADNSYYKWSGSFASGGKVVPANSTPESSGGVGPGKWLNVGDTALRKDLAAPTGVSLVGGAAKQSDLDSVRDSIYYTGKTAATHAKSLQSGTALNIKCFGDSTMWGAMPSNLANQSPNNPPKMLKEAISNLTALSNNVINYGISGTTLYDMLRGTDGSGKTYVQRLTESPCDIVYCNHCINDNQAGKDILQYRRDLITFVKSSRENNATPVLVTANPQTTILIGTVANSKRFPLFVSVMREVASDMGVDLVDNFKYMSQSLNIFNINNLFPDGVHMSDAAYRQYGYNLAIPLITCHTISEPGDTAGLSGALWFTNSTNSQISTQGARCGETVSWEREGVTTGINYPVILNRASKSLMINQLNWGSSAKAFAYVNNNSASTVYPNKNLGNSATLNWDSLTKINYNLFAGLNVIGVLIDTSTTALGTGMTFAGVSLPGISLSSMTSVAGDYYAKETLCNGDLISLNYIFVDGTECILTDNSGGKVASIKLVSGTARAAIFKDNAEVSGTNMATAVSNGTYQVTFKIADASIQFFLGAATATINTTSTQSNLKLKVASANFSLVRDL